MTYIAGKLGSKLCYLLLVITLPVLTLAQDHGQGNFTSVSDAFWQLAGLRPQPNSDLVQNPRLGGQNFTHCCLLAVNASLEVVNGFLIEKQPSFINATVDDLLAASAAGQFPCTATWNGNPAGAPIVEVPDWWLEETCPGWQLSDSRMGDESQWISPFVGFLLPAVVFCLTIPRRRKLAVWGELFDLDLSKVMSWILAPFAMIIAGFCVVCDIIIWLSICFGFASPMLLSGLYEAYLDHQILNFVKDKTENGRLTMDMRARLLFVVLVGNLDLDPEADTELTLVNNYHQDDDNRWPDGKMELNDSEELKVAENLNDTTALNGITKREDTAMRNRNGNSPFVHVQKLVHPLRTYRDHIPGTPRQWPIHNVLCREPNCRNEGCKEKRIERDARVQKEIGRVKTRLRTMLACQYSFGATVGAPVVFFLGSFVFTLVSTLSNLGDEDTSLALAFGMWYMIIPHISIVSGLLLAGNNPNTLEGVVALEYVEKEEKHILNKIFELTYESRYKPQWLWLRGRSKINWLIRIWETYKWRPANKGGKGGPVIDDDMDDLRKETRLSILDWLTVLGMTLLLMGVPFVLAFLTAFFTPQVGLSCRSFTFTIYEISQLCQLVLWIWAYMGAPEKEGHFSFFRKDGFLDKRGFYTPTDHSSIWSDKPFSLPSLWAFIWYNLAFIFGVTGVITSIGGTMMQLMGVYNSSKCDINVGWWTKPHRNVMVIISKNYALEIQDANTYWKSCAITATVFLGVVSFCGWWYQRRLRALFKGLVNQIDKEMEIR